MEHVKPRCTRGDVDAGYEYPPVAAVLPHDVVFGHSSVPGWHGIAHVDALQCVPIGWHLGAPAHGTVGTGPALRTAAGP